MNKLKIKAIHERSIILTKDSLIVDIIKWYIYLLKTCKNEGNTCIIDHHQKHYRLNSNDVIIWVIDILKTRATINIPLISIRDLLIATRIIKVVIENYNTSI